MAIGVFWKNRMKRTSAARCGSVPSSCARLSTSVRDGPGAPSAPNATSRHGGQRGEQRGALAGDDVVELETAGADLGEIVVEPVGERGVEVANVAIALGGEETGRRVIEIVDGVLQFLEHVLVALELARDVGERPHRHARLAPAFAQRTHADPQPAAGLALVGADADLLLCAPALARGLEQAIDRLRHAGIADEYPLHRPHVPAVGRSGQIEIGWIGIEHARAGVGDQDAVAGTVYHRFEQRVRRLAARYVQQAGREREQKKHPAGRQHCQQHQNERFGAGAADEQEPAASGRQEQRQQQDQTDASTPAAHPGAIERGARLLVGQPLLERPVLRHRRGIARLSSNLECLSPGVRARGCHVVTVARGRPSD
jgi:hypothetical protein